MNLMERGILAMAPGWAAKRAHSRAKVSAYEAARVTRRDRGPQPSAGGPNAEIGPTLARLRNRSRKMERDSPYAKRVINILTAHRVGYGITMRSKTGDAETDKLATAIFAAWAERADVSGLQTLDGQIEMAARSWASAGEGLLRFVRLTPAQARQKGLTLPLQVEVVEPDLLDETLNGPVAGGGQIVQGVELDRTGARSAFHFLRQHPGEASTGGMAIGARSVTWDRPGDETDRWPASEVMHLFTQERPGQQRGVPVLHPVMRRAESLDEYEEAALEKAKVEACLAAFVTRPGGGQEGTIGSDGKQRREEELSPGMIGYLDIGESVETVQPTSSSMFEPLALHFTMSYAVGTGVTHDQLTGDMRQSNYTALRTGKMEFRKAIDADHYLRVIPLVCRPIWHRVMELAVIAGLLPPRQGGYPVECMPPRHELIDPTREIPTMIRAARAGLETMPQLIASMGYIPADQLDEIKQWNKLLDSDGIILDSDARRTAFGGNAQDAKQNAAVVLGADDD